MSVIAVLIAFVTAITLVRRRRDDEDEYEAEEQKGRRRRWLKVLVMISGIIPLILFIILEDMRLPMVWIDRWTLLIGIFFLVHLVLLVVQIFAKKKAETEEGKQAA
jgi:amino acid transporter